jgi:hypothetical protein
MMDGRLFDTLEALARLVRGSAAPFGGIQVSTFLKVGNDVHFPWVSTGRGRQLRR